MSSITELQKIISEHISEFKYPRATQDLFAPVEYYLASSGKRIRPVMCLMANELFGGNIEEAMPAALAVEVFHNFSLLHDDVMDNAPIRRGRPSAHVKWNVNQALLSGDAMLVYAYELLTQLPGDVLPSVLSVFNKTSIEVCEGQQLDMDFENQEEVKLDRYLEMIRLKTSALLNGSMQMGAHTARAGTSMIRDIGKFGENLGMAFQLMDDYLDAFGGEEFGKVLGGDILANKKTYLAIRTREKADASRLKAYDQAMTDPSLGNKEKVSRITTIMREVGADLDLLSLSSEFSDKATLLLDNLEVEQSQKEPLRKLAQLLLQRTT